MLARLPGFLQLVLWHVLVAGIAYRQSQPVRHKLLIAVGLLAVANTINVFTNSLIESSLIALATLVMVIMSLRMKAGRNKNNLQNLRRNNLPM
jgi:predicted Abi (CAAX) family protease